MSNSEIQGKTPTEPMPEPYWDPLLKRDSSARHEFFITLSRLGILGRRRQVKARCDAIFVHKKGANLSFICDARQAKYCHRRPPRALLGGPASLSEVNLEDAVLPERLGSVAIAELSCRASGLDVKDCLFQLANGPLASWFAFDYQESIETWADPRPVSGPDGDLRRLGGEVRAGTAWRTPLSGHPRNGNGLVLGALLRERGGHGRRAMSGRRPPPGEAAMWHSGAWATTWSDSTSTPSLAWGPWRATRLPG